MQQPGEPSVEEILDSIKKVIARDNREGAIAQRRERSQSAARPSAARSEPIEPVDAEEAEEVLELDEDELLEDELWEFNIKPSIFIYHMDIVNVFIYH